MTRSQRASRERPAAETPPGVSKSLRGAPKGASRVDGMRDPRPISYPAPEPAEGSGKRTDELAHVLVADDDPVVQRLVRVTLADAGYDVAIASDGEEAVRIASEDSPDAIVLDLEMPRLDGRAAFREMRQRGVRSPVLILSANGAHTARRELSAEASLDKPFDPTELVRRVERLLHSWSDDGAEAAGGN